MQRDQIAFSDNNIIGRLNGLERGVTEVLNKKYLVYGLSGMQHAFFTVVCRNPGVSQKELSNWFSLDVSNIARNVMYLEKIGYVRRERCKNDKRSWRLFPTEKALRQYDQVVTIFDETTERLTVGISGEERKLLIKMLEQMRCNLLKVKMEEENKNR
ncbi:MAG: MarR family transcriptional regulator [Bacillota bacterium]|nr:MarR family transcriptional regulator [Bacillota bacterium]